MSDDLAALELYITQTPEIVVPLTGELVDLTKPAQVADALQAVRDAKNQLDEIRVLLEGALRLEAQHQGTKTLNLGDRAIVISGGQRVEYDAMQLTLRLRAAGFPEPRLAELIVETLTYKVDGRVAKSVAAANPVYAAILDECKTIVSAPWRVTLKP